MAEAVAVAVTTEIPIKKEVIITEGSVTKSDAIPAVAPTPKKSFERLKKGEDMVIRFANGDCKLEFIQNGIHMTKCVSLESVGDIFKSKKEYDTGILPLCGADYIGIRRILRLDNKFLYFFEASECKRRIKFLNEATNTRHDHLIPCPYVFLTVAFDTKTQRILTERLFASRYPVMNENVELYKFPFGNVNDGGTVCWGNCLNNKKPEELFNSNLLLLLMESDFNNHLGFYHAEADTRRDIDGLAKALREDETFDYNHLYKANKTWGSLIKEMRNAN